MCCQAKGLDEDTNPSHGNLGFVSPNPEFAEVSLKQFYVFGFEYLVLLFEQELFELFNFFF